MRASYNSILTRYLVLSALITEMSEHVPPPVALTVSIVLSTHATLKLHVNAKYI